MSKTEVIPHRHYHCGHMCTGAKCEVYGKDKRNSMGPCRDSKKKVWGGKR